MAASAVEDPAVANFRRYIRINTEQPTPDYKSCEKYLYELAKDLGLACRSVECVTGKPMVIMTLVGRDPSLPSLLLYSHTDVVPTFKEHWNCDPYEAYKDEQGNIFGRGTQDMKSVGIQYIEALRRLKNLNQLSFLRTIHVVWGPDEEIGGVGGMKPFIETDEFKKLDIGFALDEGIKVTCKGNPGHGSKFIDGTAGEKLQSIINSFLEYREKEKRRLEASPALTLGDVTTINLTKIEGGVQINVIPAEFHAYFDMRIPPTKNFDKMAAQIGEWCKKAGTDVSVEYLQHYRITNTTSTSKDDPWWNAFSSVLDELNLKYKTEIFTGATDSRFLRERGYSAIGFSPMIETPQLLHDHNEFLNEKVFLRGIDIYAQLIPRLASVPKQ